MTAPLLFMGIDEPDLHTIDGYERNGGYESLRGTTIDSGQLVALAPLLARHLGIAVTD